jgi:hypothetical protein
VAELRDNQSGTIDELEQLVNGGARSILTVALTGAATRSARPAIVDSSVVAGQRILVSDHGYEIINQTISKQRNDQRRQELASAVATDFDLDWITREQGQVIACKL